MSSKHQGRKIGAQNNKNKSSMELKMAAGACQGLRRLIIRTKTNNQSHKFGTSRICSELKKS